MKKHNGMIYPRNSRFKGDVKPCKRCGKMLTPAEAYYYVDSDNCAISNNAKPYCADCCAVVYGKHPKRGGGIVR